MIEITQTFLIRFENILGVLLYLAGTGGSYIRYAKYQRKKREDILFLICMTWGYSLLTLCLANIYKEYLVPTYHLGIARGIYYSAAIVTSMIFITKNTEQARIRNLVAAFIVELSMVFFFVEGLVFYLDLLYQVALVPCLGGLLIYWQIIFGRSSFLATAAACFLIILPLGPKIFEKGLTLDKMKQKRVEWLQKANQQTSLKEAGS